MKLTKRQKQDIKTIIESLWLFESGWSLPKREMRALVRLQKGLKYKTEWDIARQRLAK